MAGRAGFACSYAGATRAGNEPWMFLVLGAIGWLFRGRRRARVRN